MPEKKTIQRARRDLKSGKRPTTAAGEFVHEEIDHVREGKHGARSTKQAIAIGLSKARRAGVPLAPPAKGKVSERTRRSAQRDADVGQGKRKAKPKSPARSRAAKGALKREGSRAASKVALSKQAKQAASTRRRAAPKSPSKRTRR
jgi:hypothetical protein